MKNVLIILGRYLQHTTPNGICIEKIIGFWKYKCSVDIVCTEENADEVPQNIYPIKCKFPRGKLEKCIYKISKFIYAPIGDQFIVSSFEKKISEIISKKSYDAVISVINPTESAEAVFRIKRKNPNVKFILYEIDPASNRYKEPGSFVEKYWQARSKKWERKIYDCADYIIHMKTHRKHFDSNYYKKFGAKTLYLDIPSFYIEQYIWENNSKTNSIKTLTYAGAFYKGLREPDYMIDTLSKIKREDIQIKIFAHTMTEHIRNISQKLDFDAYISKSIPQNELEKKLCEADILLSVGNNHSDFLPSKVLSYISTGKPIIHFYYDLEDVSIPYLQKYDNALLINMGDNVSESAKKVDDFIDNCSFNGIDREKLKQDFEENSPEYSAEKIYELI